MKIIKTKLYTKPETAAIRRPAAARPKRKANPVAKRKAPVKTNVRRPQTENAEPSNEEKLLAALSALAWFKANPRGNVGVDKALSLQALLTSAKTAVGAKSVREWNAINRVLRGEKVKKSELQSAVDSWLRKDQTAETTTLETLYGGIKGRNSTNRKKIVENFLAMYNAQTKADAVDALRAGWHPDLGGVKGLWKTGDFGDQRETGMVKPATRRRKLGTDRRVVIKSLLEEEKSDDLDDDHKKKITAKLIRTVKDHIEDAVLSTDTKRLKTVNEVNAVAKSLIKRPLLNKELERLKGYVGLCPLNKESGKLVACWFTPNKKATTATWAIMHPNREITTPGKQGAIVQFYSKPPEYPTPTRVVTLENQRNLDSNKNDKVEKLVTDLPRLRRKWRSAFQSNTAGDRDTAAVAELLYQTGYRIGTKSNAKNNSYGIGTLKVKHILKVNGSGNKPSFEELQGMAHNDEIKSVSIRFRGKNKHLFTLDVNPVMYTGEDKRAIEKVIDVIIENVKDAQSEEDWIFIYGMRAGAFIPMDSNSMNKSLSKIGLDSDITPHNFRHLKANNIIRDFVKNNENEMKSWDEKMARKQFDGVVKEVAGDLGHARKKDGKSVESPQTTLTSYITAPTARTFFSKTLVGDLPKDIEKKIGYRGGATEVASVRVLATIAIQ